MKYFKCLVLLFLLLPGVLYSNPESEKDKVREYISEGMTAYTDKNYTRAIELLKHAFILAAENSAIAFNIACCYALKGEKDSAMTYLEKAFDLGTYKFEDEDLASLKDDDRFKELEKRGDNKIKEFESKEWPPIILLPEEFKKENKYPAVIALHGFGSNPVDFSKGLEPGITPSGYILCCPFGPEIRGTTSFGWGDYQISEKRILEALGFLKGNYKIESPKIILLGYSQGGAMCANPVRNLTLAN